MEYYLNETKLTNGQPFTIGDLTYPWSYLEILSTSQLASMGITQIKPASTFNPKYYWDADLPKNLEDREEVDSETDEPLYVKVYDPTFDNGENSQPGAMVDTTERLVSLGLKTICIAEVKSKANSILSKTDWYLYRLAEREVEVPADVAAHRAAIVAEAERLETAIATVQDVEALISVMDSQDWDDSLNPSV
jgi:hypothetical protein